MTKQTLTLTNVTRTVILAVLGMTHVQTYRNVRKNDTKIKFSLCHTLTDAQRTKLISETKLALEKHNFEFISIDCVECTSYALDYWALVILTK